MKADPPAHWQPRTVFRALYKIPPLIGEVMVYGALQTIGKDAAQSRDDSERAGLYPPCH